MPLRLAEAGQLADVLNDPLFRPAFNEFCKAQYAETMRQLVLSIRQERRDTMKEAQLAGKVEVYETIFDDLDHFAAEQLERANQ